MTSSYVGGKHNEGAAYGENRDKKQEKKQIVMGLMTDQDGCPVSIEVFPGNTADVSTLRAQVDKLQQTFGLKHVVMVGGRGSLTKKQIQDEPLPVGIDWITAMRKHQIREVVEQQSLQMSIFDEQDLMEVQSDLYPEDRLILCRNPLQAQKSKQQREELLVKTEAALDQIISATKREYQRLKGEGNIGVRVGRVLGKYKTAKFLTLPLRKNTFRTFAMQKQLSSKNGWMGPMSSVPA